jgi:hypothetical protein
MTETLDFELTADEIRILAALVYQPVPRVWMLGRWCCPFCLELNGKKRRQCSCGVPRDAEFVEESTAPPTHDEFTHPEQLNAWIPDFAASFAIYAAPRSTA